MLRRWDDRQIRRLPARWGGKSPRIGLPVTANWNIIPRNRRSSGMSDRSADTLLKAVTDAKAMELRDPGVRNCVETANAARLGRSAVIGT
jgi:hypothetical protein